MIQVSVSMSANTDMVNTDTAKEDTNYNQSFNKSH